MRISNTVVSAIVIAAILVSAYALGLLIRQARTGGLPGQSSGDVRDATAARLPEVAPGGPGTGRTPDTPEERAKLRDQRAQDLEKMKALTSEEKEKLVRSQVRQQVSGRRGGKGPQGLVPQLRHGQRTKGQGPAEAVRQPQDANAPVPQGNKADTKPGAEVGRAGTGAGRPS